MCVTICGKFYPDEGVVAGYDNRIWVKSPAKWGVQIAGMFFQTRSSMIQYLHFYVEFSVIPAIYFLITAIDAFLYLAVFSAAISSIFSSSSCVNGAQ